MQSKIGAAAIVLTSAMFALAGGSAMTHAAAAQEGAVLYAACGSPSPCLAETNTSSGPGMKSSSSRGNGLIATTKALGSIATNGGSALFGQDLQTTTGDGVFNVGVTGKSSNGTGVKGSGAVGVSAATNSTTGTGIIVAAPSTSLTTSLMKGIGYNGTTVFSLDSVGNAVFGDAGIGAGGGVLVRGYAGNNIPLITAANQNGTIFGVFSGGGAFVNGVFSVSDNFFVSSISGYNGSQVNVNNSALNANFGFTSTDPFDSGTNYVATDSPGVTWLYQGYSTTAGKYTVEMGDSGSVYARVFITTGAPIVSQKTSAGARVDTYAPQSAQPTLEDFGEAQLTDGVASVPLDPRFASAIDNTTRYYVMLTPEGDCRGLYVARRDSAGFTVRELQGGRSSIAFTYRIVARPLGDNSARLAPSTLPYGFEHAVPSPQVHRAPHRAVRNLRS